MYYNDKFTTRTEKNFLTWRTSVELVTCVYLTLNRDAKQLFDLSPNNH